MKNTIINGKKYSVEHIFNMVGNWHFIDKNGIVYLVDGEDVIIFGGGFDCYYKFDGEDTDGTEWFLCTTHDELALSQNASCSKWVNNPKITVDTAIAYAKELASENDGIFWWTVKTV